MRALTILALGLTLGLGEREARADSYVAVLGGSLHRAPKLGSKTIKIEGLRVFRVVAKHGQWFQVQLTSQGSTHCGMPQFAKVGLRMFVRTRDVIDATRADLTRRLSHGTRVFLRKGTLLHDKHVLALVPKRARVKQFALNPTWIRSPVKANYQYTRTHTRLMLGKKHRIPLGRGTKVIVKRKTPKRLLVQVWRPCMHLTGWVPRNALEPVTDDEGGVEGGIPGGVAGGVLGGVLGSRRSTWLPKNSPVYWPDGARAGLNLFTILLSRPINVAGVRRCTRFSIGDRIADTTLCFDATSLRQSRTRPSVGRPPPPPPPASRPRIVPSMALEQLRIRGQRRVLPEPPVRVAMARSGVTRVIATFKMCVGAAGRVRSLEVLKSSGFAAYDRQLTKAMRGWAYRPFKINGTATPVCTAVTFIYKPR